LKEQQEQQKTIENNQTVIKEQNINILAGDYFSLFESTNLGQAILADLMKQFDSGITFVAGDSGFSAFKEGQRSVMVYIYQMIANIKQDSKEG